MRRMKSGLGSLFLTIIVIAILATPVQGAVAYSKQCDTDWDYTVAQGLTVSQKYDNQNWDPGSNSSQSDRFWQDEDDVNISLQIILRNNHNGLQKELVFKYIVDVSISASEGSTYTIIEGADSSINEEYSKSIDIDYLDSSTRNLYVEVTDVQYEGMIQLFITVKVFDGLQQIAENSCNYYWVGTV